MQLTDTYEPSCWNILTNALTQFFSIFYKICTCIFFELLWLWGCETFPYQNPSRRATQPENRWKFDRFLTFCNYRFITHSSIHYGKVRMHPLMANMRNIGYLDFLMAQSYTIFHDDVIKWKHFPRHWPFVRGIHRSPVNSPHKGQWRGALMFSLICAWIHGWVNNRDAGDLRRHRVHYEVIVMYEPPCMLSDMFWFGHINLIWICWVGRKKIS